MAIDQGPRSSNNEGLTKALDRLVDQSVWANRQWIEYVYAQPDAEVRPRELLAHIILGERLWLDRVYGRPPVTTTFPLMNKDELIQGLAANVESFRQLIGTRLEDVVDFKRGSGEEYHARVEDIIYHLLTHGYHHRGQLAAHYVRSGVKYPNTDHINFLLQNGL